MAEISDLAKGNCLVWDTEKPYEYLPRKSSNFSLLGCEWNVKLDNLVNEGCFSISLNKVTDGEPLETDFTITTFVYSKNSKTCLYSVDTGRKANREIWRYGYDTIEKATKCSALGAKWRVIFYIYSPLTLQQSKTETDHNPPGTDTADTLTSASESSNISRVMSFEEECDELSTLDIFPDILSLWDDYLQRFSNASNPDVQLRCGDRSFSVYSSILASESDLFAAIFRNKMAESETCTVDIKDMDADVLLLLLQYVYLLELPELTDDTAPSLYEAGDKYSIPGLKSECSDWRVGSLTAKNCLCFLTLADAHSDEDFKDRVVSFVAENLEALEKQAWSEFSKDHSELAVSVYERRLASTLSKQA